MLLLTLCKSSQPTTAVAVTAVSYPSYLKISGPTESFTGPVAKIETITSDGLMGMRFTLEGMDGSATITVLPWPTGLVAPDCASGCSGTYMRHMLPDGPEARLELRRLEKIQALAVSKGRIRSIALSAPVHLEPGAATGMEFSGRQSVQLKVNGAPVEAGQTHEIKTEKDTCKLMLYQASVAKPPRKGIAEEAAAFTADWILRCN